VNVGNFGGTRFFDYTAYGDTINIAARLEVASKQLGTRIWVSERVARQVGNPGEAGGVRSPRD
jgi:class 3 adenylate cyclase